MFNLTKNGNIQVLQPMPQWTTTSASHEGMTISQQNDGVFAISKTPGMITGMYKMLPKNDSQKHFFQTGSLQIRAQNLEEPKHKRKATKSVQ